MHHIPDSNFHEWVLISAQPQWAFSTGRNQINFTQHNINFQTFRAEMALRFWIKFPFYPASIKVFVTLCVTKIVLSIPLGSSRISKISGDKLGTVYLGDLYTLPIVMPTMAMRHIYALIFATHQDIRMTHSWQTVGKGVANGRTIRSDISIYIHWQPQSPISADLVNPHDSQQSTPSQDLPHNIKSSSSSLIFAPSVSSITPLGTSPSESTLDPSNSIPSKEAFFRQLHFRKLMVNFTQGHYHAHIYATSGFVDGGGTASALPSTARRKELACIIERKACLDVIVAKGGERFPHYFFEAFALWLTFKARIDSVIQHPPNGYEPKKDGKIHWGVAWIGTYPVIFGCSKIESAWVYEVYE
ncbi:uncharacterized protein LACBIDRAFT_333752 [Laccaria bicolor S238N-H82]|uniref:Predicted protein n=1 Tax=Laccaria bicolor (strain S238N-H82 / ATCC MYA-4686) TaxID=486041 RepID=B0DWY6_LACBS|nr:uncharacterized protein LACBIDRAFT_333752 [Laccaria bicolor S238N-H82]EDR00841.1 predicted protein [Laccaria bicolor S238N-H82]|eukprot:XP_001888435.1 predicted protein [Laccaria bicolor S238N-H82]